MFDNVFNPIVFDELFYQILPWVCGIYLIVAIIIAGYISGKNSTTFEATIFLLIIVVLTALFFGPLLSALILCIILMPTLVFGCIGVIIALILIGLNAYKIGEKS